MKRSFSSTIIVLILLMFYACKKDSPTPDNPENPEPEPPGLSFPKKEMRAIWISTAWGLDWPQGVYNAEAQRQQYITYLDRFKQLNINAVFFQVKAMGDAFYQSPYEPWSASITGTRGMDAGYDALKFLVDEAHARGIEFHAWINPYRIATRAGSGSAYAALHSSVKSEWVVSHEKIQIYNPALPEVRQRLSDIVRDIISKYDVDGIHFDDYFYPDPSSAGQMVSDQSDYEKYGQGYTSIQDFRRGNVDKAIKAVYDVIVATKPQVVFSVSPAPSQSYNLNTLFADVTKWCQEGWVDLIIPQLYQEIGNSSNDFRTNLSWWAQFNYKAALMIGHGYYKFGDPTTPSAFQSTSELEKQFDLTKNNKKVVGNAMYSAKYILQNKIGITDKLASIYSAPAVLPFLGRTVAAAPGEARNVRIESGVLKWEVTGDVKSVIYYFPDLTKVGKVYAVTTQASIAANSPGFYCVSTVNVDNQESKPSVAVEKK